MSKRKTVAQIREEATTEGYEKAREDIAGLMEERDNVLKENRKLRDDLAAADEFYQKTWRREIMQALGEAPTVEGVLDVAKLVSQTHEERKLFRQEAITHLVTKNSGGEATAILVVGHVIRRWPISSLPTVGRLTWKS